MSTSPRNFRTIHKNTGYFLEVITIFIRYRPGRIFFLSMANSRHPDRRMSAVVANCVTLLRNRQ